MSEEPTLEEDWKWGQANPSSFVQLELRLTNPKHITLPAHHNYTIDMPAFAHRDTVMRYIQELIPTAFSFPISSNAPIRLRSIHLEHSSTDFRDMLNDQHWRTFKSNALYSQQGANRTNMVLVAFITHVYVVPNLMNKKRTQPSAIPSQGRAKKKRSKSALDVFYAQAKEDLKGWTQSGFPPSKSPPITPQKASQKYRQVEQEAKQLGHRLINYRTFECGKCLRPVQSNECLRLNYFLRVHGNNCKAQYIPPQHTPEETKQLKACQDKQQRVHTILSIISLYSYPL